MTTTERAPAQASAAADWKTIVARYQKPSRARAIWQLVNTVGSYVALWGFMAWSTSISWWITLPVAALAGLFLVRTSIVFHDCGHGSFFASRRANAFWGFVTGLLTFTPYYHWRGEHAIHHGTTADLDRRGVGDVWTMTVQEYLESSRWKRFAYRLARNPIILFGIAPAVLFVVVQRFSRKGASVKERRSVWWMNGALLAMAVGMSAIYGVVPYVLIQLTVLVVAGGVGVWLFYLQHQFEDVYWERGGWDYAAAALQGSSFLRLPRVLQWFSGNIGFHHVHDLSPRIPNYNLERCHRSDPLFHEVEPMSPLAGIKALSLRLWDESAKKLVGFRHIRKIRRGKREQERARSTRGKNASD